MDGRRTLQRKVIKAVFEGQREPLSVEGVLNAARKITPRVGIATVYRTLKNLVACGEVQAVELPGKQTVYESAGRHHHHHFCCRCCERVFEVESCPGEMNSLCPPGFTLERHEIILYGLCTTCGASA